MCKFPVGVFIIFIYCFLAGCTGKRVSSGLEALFLKDEVTLVITDSGLGGISVMDDLSKKIKAARCFKKVSLIFVNALFDPETGYNALKTRNDKIEKLNAVLAAIDEKFKPDAILIACNTLSVLYKNTGWFTSTKKLVIDIVEPGIKLIKDKLTENDGSDVIIFGTETTIEENNHKKALVEAGIDEKRIIAKACPQLQSFIEQNPAGEETSMLISVYVSEAMEQLPKGLKKVYLSLNCSHFGYSTGLWKKAIPVIENFQTEILNPNFTMSDLLIPEKYQNRFSQTEITMNVISKVEIVNKKSIMDFYKESNPELASAIAKYKIIADLF